MGFCSPKRYICLFSVHVGVVVICSMGLLIMCMSTTILFALHKKQMAITISAITNIVLKDPEPDPLYIAAHWIIVLAYLSTGFCIYLIGMTAAYMKSPRLACLTCCGLSIHFLFWITICALPFVNDYKLNRIFCIDNRCADRLFIKNSGWRIFNAKLCENPSKRNSEWLEAMEKDATESTDPTTVGLNLTSTMASFPTDAFATTDAQEDGTQTDEVYDFGDVTEIDADETLEDIGDRAANDSIYGNHADNGLYIETPLGLEGCNNPAHMAFSGFCSILILIFWYLHPIMVLRSFARRLRNEYSGVGAM